MSNSPVNCERGWAAVALLADRLGCAALMAGGCGGFARGGPRYMPLYSSHDCLREGGIIYSLKKVNLHLTCVVFYLCSL
jgi:hypothetical protein